MSDLIYDMPFLKKSREDMEALKIFKNLFDDGFFNSLSEKDKQNLKEGFDNLSQIENLIEKFKFLDEFNAIYQQKGWIATESMNFEMTIKAVNIAKEESIEKGEEFLVDYYSSHLKESLSRLNYPEDLRKREHLINWAYNDYIEERYYSCIFLLLSIMDGFVADFNIAEGKGLFDANDENLYSWDSIAVHKTGLIKIRKLLYQNRGETVEDEIFLPYRNGIMHGRDLNFNNKMNATKLWATLYALKDGAIILKNNGKNPPKEEETLSLYDLSDKILKHQEESKKLQEELDKWENRNLTVNKDFPEFGPANEYEDGSPERELVNFFDYWKTGNFGYIQKMEYYNDFEEIKEGKRIHELKTEVFSNKKLKSFKILKIDDESIITAIIKTELKIEINSEEIKKNLNFRFIYTNEKNKPIAVRTLNNGKWKISTFNDIERLSK